MKKINLIIITIVAFFISLNTVSAASTKVSQTREYNQTIMMTMPIYSNLLTSNLVYCGSQEDGGVGIRKIPVRIVKLVNTIVKIIYIGAAIVLIILGMIDLAKGITSQKEDVLAKGRRTFIKRLITAVIMFLVVLIVKWGIGMINNVTDNANIIDCIDCFINDGCHPE